MGPGGAVEAGFSNGAAAAAEAAGTAAVNAAVATAPSVLRGAAAGVENAAQGVAATAEQTTQAVGTAAEAGVAPVAAAESATNLASSAEAALGGQEGPDVALNTIAAAPASPEPVSDSRQAPGITSIPEASAEVPPAAEVEEVAPTVDAPRIPSRVANDPAFRQSWGELYAKSKQEGGQVDVAQIDRQALDEYYDNLATEQMGKGLPEEIRDDPLFQKELGRAAVNTQRRGEPLDQDKLTKEALAKFRREKDLQEEQGILSPEQLSATEQRLQRLEQNVVELAAINKQLTEQLMTLQNDPKKKTQLLELLKRIGLIIAITGTSAVIEGRTVVPNPQQR